MAKLRFEMVGLAEDLLERVSQLSALGDCWDRARTAGRGSLVTIGGEAGAGKTSLVKYFCDHAPGRPRVLAGACEPLFTARPCGPFLDIVHAQGSSTSALAAVLPSGRPDEVASALISDIQSGSAAIVVLEDLHWADEATLDVLRLLARRAEANPALIVVTYRDDGLDRTHPLRIVLGDLPIGVIRLRVPPLTESAVTKLAERSGLDGGALHRKTGGNPFFVTEVLAAGAPGIPDTVRDAVLGRVGRLRPATRSVVEALSVLPPHAEPWLLDALVPSAITHIADCLASGVVQTVGSAVAFRHELARLAVEESLDPGQRVLFHRAAVEALSSPPGASLDLARLAHHADAASDSAAVMKFAPQAAAEAVAVGAHREAAAQYDLALRHSRTADDRARADLYEHHSRESYLADDAERAIASGSAAVAIHKRLGDNLEQAGALLKLSTLHRFNGEFAAAVAHVGDAIALLAEVPPCRELALAYAAVAQIAMCTADEKATITAGTEALRLAESLSDTEALVHVLISVGTMEMETANWQVGHEKLVRSIELAQAAGLDELVGRAYNNLVYEGYAHHDLSAVEGYLRDAVAYSTDRGSGFWLHLALSSRAELELLQGNWDSAAETAWSVIQCTTSAVPRMSALTVLGLVRARRGDPDAWGPLDDALAIAKATGELQSVAPVAAARSEVAWLEGRVDAVKSETDAFVEKALRGNDHWVLGEVAYWRWKIGLAEPDVAADDRSPRLLQRSGCYAEAAARWEALGYPYEVGLAWSDSDDVDDLRQSHKQFRSLGASAAAAVVARRLRQRGARGIPRGPRASTASNPALLTRREMEVLSLVAEGLRDSEIAERLFLSEKTVGHHVSALLRKLQASTRGHAAALARQRGVLPPTAAHEN